MTESFKPFEIINVADDIRDGKACLLLLHNQSTFMDDEDLQQERYHHYATYMPKFKMLMDNYVDVINVAYSAQENCKCVKDPNIFQADTLQIIDPEINAEKFTTDFMHGFDPRTDHLYQIDDYSPLANDKIIKDYILQQNYSRILVAGTSISRCVPELLLDLFAFKKDHKQLRRICLVYDMTDSGYLPDAPVRNDNTRKNLAKNFAQNICGTEANKSEHEKLEEMFEKNICLATSFELLAVINPFIDLDEPAVFNQQKIAFQKRADLTKTLN